MTGLPNGGTIIPWVEQFVNPRPTSIYTDLKGRVRQSDQFPGLGNWMAGEHLDGWGWGRRRDWGQAFPGWADATRTTAWASPADPTSPPASDLPCMGLFSGFPLGIGKGSFGMDFLFPLGQSFEGGDICFAMRAPIFRDLFTLFTMKRGKEGVTQSYTQCSRSHISPILHGDQAHANLETN